jgi:hypothetical protein
MSVLATMPRAPPTGTVLDDDSRPIFGNFFFDTIAFGYDICLTPYPTPRHAH